MPFISVAAVALSFVVGSVLGCLAGYFGGRLDAALNRVLDMVMAFPLFVLVTVLGLTLLTAFASNVASTAMALPIVGATALARSPPNRELRRCAWMTWPMAINAGRA